MRTCGSCTLCCTLQGVREGMPPDGGEKLPNVRCPFVRAHPGSCGGCSIYDTRPQECRTYACMWLEGLGKNADRPDRLGVMFEVQHTDTPPHPFILARTTTKGKELGERAAAIIRGLRARGLAVVVVHPEDVRGWRTEIATAPDGSRT